VSFHPQMPYERGFQQSERKLPPEGEPFAFTPERREAFERRAAQYPPEQRKSAMPLRDLPRAAAAGLRHRERHAPRRRGDRVHAAEVEDVVSYYAMFYRQPVGKYVIQVCRTLSCALRGAERVTEAISGQLGVEVGGTDPTGTFTLVEVECLGACDRAPVVMVNDGWHECLAPEDAVRLLGEIEARARRRSRGVITRWKPSAGRRRRRRRWRGRRQQPAACGMEPVLTRRSSGARTAYTLDFYLQHQGYEGLRKALTMTPDAVIDEVKRRGCAAAAAPASPPA
jgi:NADH-quinone oxidoreductase subunit E